MKILEKNINRRLKVTGTEPNVRILGVENPLTHNGSRTVNRQDFPLFTRQNHCALILGLQGVRIRKERSMACVHVFYPLQALFCARRKGAGKDNKKPDTRGAHVYSPRLPDRARRFAGIAEIDARRPSCGAPRNAGLPEEKPSSAFVRNPARESSRKPGAYDRASGRLLITTNH